MNVIGTATGSAFAGWRTRSSCLSLGTRQPTLVDITIDSLNHTRTSDSEGAEDSSTGYTVFVPINSKEVGGTDWNTYGASTRRTTFNLTIDWGDGTINHLNLDKELVDRHGRADNGRHHIGAGAYTGGRKSGTTYQGVGFYSNDETKIVFDATDRAKINNFRTHTYATAGDYQIKIYGNFDGFHWFQYAGLSTANNIDNVRYRSSALKNSIKKITWGDLLAKSMIGAASGCTSLERATHSNMVVLRSLIVSTDGFGNRTVSSYKGLVTLKNIYKGCTSLKTIHGNAVNENVNKLTSMFHQASDLAEDEALNCQYWKLNNVENVHNMFFRAGTNMKVYLLGWSNLGSASYTSWCYHASFNYDDSVYNHTKLLNYWSGRGTVSTSTGTGGNTRYTNNFDRSATLSTNVSINFGATPVWSGGYDGVGYFTARDSLVTFKGWTIAGTSNFHTTPFADLGLDK